MNKVTSSKITSSLMKNAPLITMVIWGSMYVANRVILENIPVMVLLFIRFAVSGTILLAIAKLKGMTLIRREDLGLLMAAAIPGYFVCEGALLLGTRYSNAGFASLMNSLNPVTISVFAMIFLREKLSRRDALSLLIAVLGAVIIIGNPGEGITFAGIFFSLLAVVIWSYVTTVPIRRLSAKYDPIVVTGAAMLVASLPAIPASAVYMNITGETVRFTGSLLLPVLYVTIVCTAGAHLLWNKAMSTGAAVDCAAFYPFQPLTSMLLGVLLLGENCSVSFLLGAAMILFSIMIRQAKTGLPVHCFHGFHSVHGFRMAGRNLLPVHCFHMAHIHPAQALRQYFHAA